LPQPRKRLARPSSLTEPAHGPCAPSSPSCDLAACAAITSPPSGHPRTMHAVACSIFPYGVAPIGSGKPGPASKSISSTSPKTAPRLPSLRRAISRHAPPFRHHVGTFFSFAVARLRRRKPPSHRPPVWAITLRQACSRLLHTEAPHVLVREAGPSSAASAGPVAHGMLPHRARKPIGPSSRAEYNMARPRTGHPQGERGCYKAMGEMSHGAQAARCALEVLAVDPGADRSILKAGSCAVLPA
jgi:hypothetical protein